MWDITHIDRLRDEFVVNGFALFKAPNLNKHDLEHLYHLQHQWANFPLDSYLPDGGDYRFRQYSALKVDATGNIFYQKHQPFYQPTETNQLMGGIHRQFEPVSQEVRNNHLFARILLGVVEILNSILKVEACWDIDAHCFRVIAREGIPGQPVPRGIFHNEGKDFVAIVLIDRKNIDGGSNLIAESNGFLKFNHTLLSPLELLLIDDRRLMHVANAISTSVSFGYRDIVNLDISLGEVRATLDGTGVDS